TPATPPSSPPCARPRDPCPGAHRARRGQFAPSHDRYCSSGPSPHPFRVSKPPPRVQAEPAWQRATIHILSCKRDCCQIAVRLRLLLPSLLLAVSALSLG